MKEWLRKWLGIPSDAQLRKLVGEAVESALEGKHDADWSMWGFRPDIKNTLTDALEAASIETATKTAQLEVQGIVGTETFIDDVVARIQRKQV